jgi:hypothetical protein
MKCLQEPMHEALDELRFDLPSQIHQNSCSVANTTLQISKPISVASNASILQEQRSIGLKELETVQKLIESISSVGCVECWFFEQHVDRSTLPHNHTHDAPFKAYESTLKSKTIPSSRHWPFCYLCWVPFRAPCFHPPHKKDGIANPEQCPSPGTLHRLVNLIWHEKGKHNQLEHLLQVSPGGFSRFPSFTSWMFTATMTAAEIPRPHQFLVAYYREYRCLPM